MAIEMAMYYVLCSMAILPEMRRDEQERASVKFEQIHLFYPRGGAAPLLGIAPIKTLERFVVYCSCEQIVLAAPPGVAQRAQGIAQAVTRHSPISKLKLKVESQTSGGFA